MDILILSLITSLLGSYATYLIIHELDWNPVLASSLCSLIFTLITLIIPLPSLNHIMPKLTVLFMGATFIGMSSRQIIKNQKQLIIATLYYFIIFTTTSTFFKGIGGNLGTSAAIGVISYIGTRALLNQLFLKTKNRGS